MNKKNHLTAAITPIATVSSKEQLPGNFRGMEFRKQKVMLVTGTTHGYAHTHTHSTQLNFL